ncbi:MAG: 50S ribosomal protein L3 [Planctomycetota bacterium]
MVKALLGKKIGMTQVFDEDGTQVPVTVLQVGPCPVVQLKEGEEGVCTAVQIGYDERKRKNTPAPLLGHFDKAGVNPTKVLRDVEPEVDGEGDLEVGQKLDVSVFQDVDKVDVSGRSKGRGFAGVVKRHGFAGGPKTHGGKMDRRSGSIGPGTDPGHVIKGRRMAGHMGDEVVTTRNLEVVRVDAERNVLLVKGSVPGSNESYVMVRKVEQDD